MYQQKYNTQVNYLIFYALKCLQTLLDGRQDFTYFIKVFYKT